MAVILGEQDIEATRWVYMADSNFHVFELSRKPQLRLKLQQLPILLSKDILVQGIKALQVWAKLKWRIPYGRIITRGTDKLRLNSAWQK